MSQLIEDCATGENYIYCPGSSCSYIQDNIQEILDKTLVNWNKKYYLIVNGTNDITFGTACSATEEVITSSPCCALPTKGQPIIITLQICG